MAGAWIGVGSGRTIAFQVLAKLCRDKSGRHIHSGQAEALVSARKLFSTTRVLQQVGNWCSEEALWGPTTADANGVAVQIKALYASFDLQVHGPYAGDIGKGKLTTSELFRKHAAKALPAFEMTPNYAYHHRWAVEATRCKAHTT